MSEAQQSTLDVHVYVASYNTAESLELGIRSMREYAGFPFRLTVGDCGSQDGSASMLEEFEERGWLELQQAGRKRLHAEWLDEWRADADSQLVVFADSDVEFLGHDWLRDLVEAASQHQAALVFVESCPEVANFVEPVGNVTIRLAARPAPWLMMFDVARTAHLPVSFAFEKEETDRVPEGIIAYDVGGMFFRAVDANGLKWVQMPAAYRRRFHHYGGFSWIPFTGRRGFKKWRDLQTVRRHLKALRAKQERGA